MKDFWDKHKTKIMGSLVAIAGSLLANGELLKTLLTPKQYGWLFVILGLAIAVIGVWNSQKSGEARKIQ